MNIINPTYVERTLDDHVKDILKKYKVCSNQFPKTFKVELQRISNNIIICSNNAKRGFYKNCKIL